MGVGYFHNMLRSDTFLEFQVDSVFIHSPIVCYTEIQAHSTLDDHNNDMFWICTWWHNRIESGMK